MPRHAHAFWVALVVIGCGGSTDADATGATGGAAGATGSGASGGAAGSATGGAAGSGASGGAAGSATGGAGGTSTGGAGGSSTGGGGSVADPSLPGPNTGAPFDGTATVSATKHQVPMHCVLPVGTSSATAPVILIGHGFQLPAKQYNGYADRLASHGFIACTVDFPAGFSPNHAAAAQDMSGALDWVLVQSATAGSPLQGKVDINQIGVMGHSLGGKVSVLAAKADVRFKAVLGLDPVDAATGCTDKTLCPDASDTLPQPIPTAFLGETLDATGSFQACAPAADNYQTFFAKAGAPSVEVTLNGANHMSFIDDVGSCGLTCSFCNKATLPQADALAVARAYSVAFFARYLRGQAGYDAWLTGDLAKQKWAGKINLQSK
ncbi:MAG: alpha/beta hydrolase [Myxococcales bacterium]|nr:alpha/beta hydrolase [Myxococcales bacterium]